MRKILITAVASLALAATVAGSDGYTTAKPAKTKANIVQTAVASGQFTTLVTLVKKAGLAGTLSGKGPFTVFAPTDAAFAKVPKATLAALGKDKAKLKAVLLYHVVSGKVPAAPVVCTRSLPRNRVRGGVPRARPNRAVCRRGSVVHGRTRTLVGRPRDHRRGSRD